MQQRKVWKIVASGVAVAAMITMVGTVSAQSDGAAKAGPSAMFGTCKKSFTSGTGVTKFAWCFTTEGSIAALQHPQDTYQLTGFDGFCLSAEPTAQPPVRYSSASGLNAPTYPTATSVQHKTTDGKFIVTQTFAQNTATKTITVTMKVKNVSGVPQALSLARQADFDAGGTSVNSFVQTGRTVQATDPGDTTAVLAGTTNGQALATMTLPYNFDFDASLDNQCYNADADAAIGPVAGDSMAAVQYVFGQVNTGVTKTVKFTYQVIF